MPKYANCKGSYKSASMNCPIRKDALDRARHAVLTCEPLHRVPQYLQQKSTHQINPTPSEAARIVTSKTSKTTKTAKTQAPKKVAKKATTTTMGKKAKSTKTVPAPAPEPASEPVPEPVPESTTGPTTASIAASIEAPIEIVNEPAPIRTGPYTPLLPPEAPQPLSRTSVRGPTKAIPLKINAVAEKRPRGRPPKPKSSNNDDQDPDPEPREHIDTALIASQPNPPTIDPALLENLMPSSTAPPTPPNVDEPALWDIGVTALCRFACHFWAL